MKLGVLINLYGALPLAEAIEKVQKLGIEAIEIGAGGYPGKNHCDPAELLADAGKLRKFRQTIERSGIHVAALAAHGNPVHPDAKIAAEYDSDFKNAILLAEQIGVDTVVGFSGCPGDCPDSALPNWVTCAWPPDYLQILDYQWNEVLIPYWQKTAAFSAEHGVNRIAFEMHPGFCVYNPATLLRLREAVGDVIGANFDPSHLIWQGIDPMAAIRALGNSIYHVHAKDTKIDPYNSAVNGVLDTGHYSDEIHRSWIFRTVGYGHDAQYWKDMVSALRLSGYDRVLSIEHEDSLMTIDEGLAKAAGFLQNIIIREPKPGTIGWA